MPLTNAEEQELIRYLLGDELSERVQARIESRYIKDDRYFDELERIEKRLTEDYAAERLPERERILFEKSPLSAGRRKRRLEVLQGMQRFFSQAQAKIDRPTAAPAPERQHKPRPGYWLAWGSAALGAAACAGLIFSELQLREELRSAQLAARTAASARPRTAAAIPSFVLEPGIARGESAQRVIRYPLVQLHLKIPELSNYSGFEAGLETPSGKLILKQNRLSSQSAGGVHFVPIEIPASVLSPGDYVLTLSGRTPGNKWERLRSYIFRVEEVSPIGMARPVHLN